MCQFQVDIGHKYIDVLFATLRYFISEAAGTKKTNNFASKTKISEKYAFVRPYFHYKSLQNIFLVISVVNS